MVGAVFPLIQPQTPGFDAYSGPQTPRTPRSPAPQIGSNPFVRKMPIGQVCPLRGGFQEVEDNLFSF